MPTELTPETLRRIDTGTTFLNWIMPRLSGDGEDKETALVMILAQMEDRYLQGVQDATSIAQEVARRRPASREAAAITTALGEMIRRHSAERVTDLGPDTTKPGASE